MPAAEAGGEFLKRAAVAVGAAAAPYVITSQALGGEGRPPASDRVVLGYLGVGPRGMVNVRDQLACADAQLVAVCDVWKDRREQAKSVVDAHYKNSDCRAYQDFREVIARDDIDAVGIASTDHWHVPMTIAAARSGKDVHVEKPLGVSLAEDLACRETIKRYGRVFQYGTEARSMAACRQGCELVRNGRIGEIREIHVTAPNSIRGGTRQAKPVPPELDYDLWVGPAPWRPYSGCPDSGPGWYHVYDYALGFIAGWGAHPLDLLLWAYDLHETGPWEVEGTGTIPTEGCNDAVIDWNCRIRLGNGVPVTYRAHGLGPDQDPGLTKLGNYAQLIGTEGWVALYYGGFLCQPDSLRQVQLGPNDIHLPVSPNHERNFIDCVKSRGTPVSHVDDAVRSDTISHVCDIAIREGRKLVWDPAKEEFVNDPAANRRCVRAVREAWGK